MSDETKKLTNGTSLTFDKKYWPTCTTEVASKPFDLHQLWIDDDDACAASVFIAETLIDSDDVSLQIALHGKETTVECLLWWIGGDIVRAQRSLIECLEEQFDRFEEGCDEEDAEDQIAALERVRDRITELIDKYKVDAPVRAEREGKKQCVIEGCGNWFDQYDINIRCPECVAAKRKTGMMK